MIIMRKIRGIILIFILLISLFPLAIAQNNSDNQSLQDTTTQQQDSSKINKGFACLEDEVEGECSSLSIQEIALTVLASPKEDILDECVDALKAKQSSTGCWPSGSCKTRETALAILALHHIGENTDKAEKWLVSKNQTADDLIWYLEQDSNDKTQCKISYSGEDYTINIDDNKKIDSNAGSCLTRAVSNFWLRVSSDCYNKEFAVSCDKKFIATLLYQHKDSPTLYVLKNTESEPAFGTINLKINAKCFPPSSGSCDYESTAWAALALLRTGHNIESFIPYLISLTDSNEQYLPKAFVYMVTNYQNYGNELIQEQKLGNYWLAEYSAYNKFYDTALALLALTSSSSEPVIKARDWLLFSQSSDGCWKNSNNEIIRDTAIILWALEGRAGSVSPGATTYCSEANYFCIPESECPESEKLTNYFCTGLNTVCCENENLKLCSEYDGVECASDEFCDGNERRAANTNYCCLDTCEIRSQETECEKMGYVCLDACSEDQEMVSYSCDGSEVCCRTKTEPSSTWWIWVLIIGIIVLLGIIAWILRARLKLFWFKIKSKFKKDKGGAKPSGSGFPPKPGFPPIRRTLMTRPVKPSSRDKSMDNVFSKLKEMSK
jgi:hypothetical protein